MLNAIPESFWATVGELLIYSLQGEMLIKLLNSNFGCTFCVFFFFEAYLLSATSVTFSVSL